MSEPFTDFTFQILPLVVGAFLGAVLTGVFLRKTHNTPTLNDDASSKHTTSKHDSENSILTSPEPIQTPLTFVAETLLPTSHGLLRVRAYRSPDGSEPLALIAGDVRDGKGVPVRVHDACLTSEALGSQKCDCAQQLSLALSRISNLGRGVVIYMPQEGRGIGLANKIAVYAQQEKGLDTVQANLALGFPEEARTYEAAKEILDDIGVKSVTLLSNNPHKFKELKKLGIVIEAREAVLVTPTPHSHNYLKVKRSKMGHDLTHIESNEGENDEQGGEKVESAISTFRTLIELRA